MSRFSPVAAALIAVAVFLLDTLTTFDIAIAVLYVVVVLLSLNFANQTQLVAIGAGCMGLTLLSFLLSHGLELPAEVNRTLLRQPCCHRDNDISCF